MNQVSVHRSPLWGHIDTAQTNLGKDKSYLFVAIDRATRYVYLGLHDLCPRGYNKRMETATRFLENTVAQYPFKIEKILTDNGIEFSYNPLAGQKKPKGKEHPFAALCKAKGIGHRTTLVKHPWTNGMVEAMNKKVIPTGHKRPTRPNGSITTMWRH